MLNYERVLTDSSHELLFKTLFFLFQSPNTRSQKEEKDKNPVAGPSEPELPEESDLDNSVMDRTRKLKQMRDQHKKKARSHQAAEEEALQFDQLVADLKEKVEATKAAKARTAESRRVIAELQSDLADEEDPLESDQDSDTPDSKSDIGALVASSIQSAVSYLIPMSLNPTWVSFLSLDIISLY